MEFLGVNEHPCTPAPVNFLRNNQVTDRTITALMKRSEAGLAFCDLGCR